MRKHDQEKTGSERANASDAERAGSEASASASSAGEPQQKGRSAAAEEPATVREAWKALRVSSAAFGKKSGKELRQLGKASARTTKDLVEAFQPVWRSAVGVGRTLVGARRAGGHGHAHAGAATAGGKS